MQQKKNGRIQRHGKLQKETGGGACSVPQREVSMRSWFKSYNAGFTLIELLVVVGIVAIIATVVTITLNPAELLRKSRDGTRLADLGNLTRALELYQLELPSGFGDASTVYVSLSDPAAIPPARTNCSSFSLPPLAPPYIYACAAPSVYRTVNGDGWIPVDFSQLPAGPPLNVLPIDPINTADGGLYYTYTPGGSWELTAKMESVEYQAGGSHNVESKDGGTNDLRYELGTDLSLAPNIGSGSSEGSNNTDVTPPSVPIGLAAISISSSQINLSWTASTDNVAVTGYRVYREEIQTIATTTGTSYLDTGLSPSTNYSYAVAAYDAAGNVSIQSIFASAITQAFSPQAAGTYYISPTGSDVNTCTQAQSSATAKLTFGSVWSCLSAGNTLSVADGTYTNPSPPADKAGLIGSIITITAQNDGGAVLTGPLSMRGNSYMEFIGFKITAPDGALSIKSNGVGKQSHHLTFRKIAAQCSNVVSNSSCISLSDGTNNVLLEDFWGWGGGRYSLLCYGGPGGSPPNLGCDNNTFRRGVLREGPDTSSSGNPQAGFALYYANNNTVENVIVLDSIPRSNSSNAGFYITAHAPPPEVSGNKFYGIIALNNEGTGFYLDHNGVGANTQIYNSVIWGSGRDGMALYAADPANCANNVVDHTTFGGNDSDGMTNLCDSLILTSNFAVSNVDSGLKNNGGSIAVSNWNGFFGNGAGPRIGISAGANDVTVTQAPLYILRTEAGTSCKGAGEGGTDCGANVINQYQSGILTSTALWPFPNEARIKADMCASIPSDPANNWCTTTKTLTRYIWEYLGNPMP